MMFKDNEVNPKDLYSSNPWQYLPNNRFSDSVESNFTSSPFSFCSQPIGSQDKMNSDNLENSQKKLFERYLQRSKSMPLKTSNVHLATNNLKEVLNNPDKIKIDSITAEIRDLKNNLSDSMKNLATDAHSSSTNILQRLDSSSNNLLQHLETIKTTYAEDKKYLRELQEKIESNSTELVQFLKTSEDKNKQIDILVEQLKESKQQIKDLNHQLKKKDEKLEKLQSEQLKLKNKEGNKSNLLVSKALTEYKKIQQKQFSDYQKKLNSFLAEKDVSSENAIKKQQQQFLTFFSEIKKVSYSMETSYQAIKEGLEKLEKKLNMNNTLILEKKSNHIPIFAEPSNGVKFKGKTQQGDLKYPEKVSDIKQASHGVDFLEDLKADTPKVCQYKKIPNFEISSKVSTHSNDSECFSLNSVFIQQIIQRNQQKSRKRRSDSNPFSNEGIYPTRKPRFQNLFI